MRIQGLVVGKPRFLPLLIGAFVALCNGLCSFAFAERPHAYHDQTLHISLQEDALRSMEIVCRYPVPLVLFHT